MTLVTYISRITVLDIPGYIHCMTSTLQNLRTHLLPIQMSTNGDFCLRQNQAPFIHNTVTCAIRQAKTDNFVAYIRIGNTTAWGRQHALYAYKIRCRKFSSCMISKTMQPLSLALHHWKDMLIHSLPASLPLREGVNTKQVTNKMYAEMHTYNKHINLRKYPQHRAMKMNVQHHSKIHCCTPKLLGVLCWPLPP